MTTVWHKIKGYVAGVTAFISCPCHLVLTLPLLVALTAGTAFSAWLQNNFLLVGVLSTLLFLVSGGLAFRWFGRAGQRRRCPAVAGLQKAPR